MADPRPLPPVLARPALAESYRSVPVTSKRLIMLDYDGTLAPHVDDPESALPTPHLLRILAALADDERNALWIISGRPGDFLERTVGIIPNIGISCEHGGFTRQPGSTEWVGRGMYDGPLKAKWEQVRHVMEKHVTRLDGAFLEYKKSSLTFAYRVASQELAAVVIDEMRADLRNILAETPDIVVKQGVFVIEVRPNGINKGEIARELINRYQNVGFALAAGDEGTDEDMFAALHSALVDGKISEASTWSIFVNGVYGLRSCARSMVGGISDFIEVLGDLAGVTTD